MHETMMLMMVMMMMVTMIVMMMTVILIKRGQDGDNDDDGDASNDRGDDQKYDDDGNTNNDGDDVDHNASRCGGSADGQGHGGNNGEGNEGVNGGDGKRLVVVMNDMDSDGGDSNNGDGVDDGSGVNYNGGADTACGDGESIVDCGADKGGGGGDSIGDNCAGTIGGGDPNFCMSLLNVKTFHGELILIYKIVNKKPLNMKLSKIKYARTYSRHFLGAIVAPKSMSFLKNIKNSSVFFSSYPTLTLYCPFL